MLELLLGLEVHGDQLAVFGLARQRIRQPVAVARQLRALHIAPVIVSVVRQRLLRARRLLWLRPLRLPLFGDERQRGRDDEACRDQESGSPGETATVHELPPL